MTLKVYASQCHVSVQIKQNNCNIRQALKLYWFPCMLIILIFGGRVSSQTFWQKCQLDFWKMWEKGCFSSVLWRKKAAQSFLFSPLGLTLCFTWGAESHFLKIIWLRTLLNAHMKIDAQNFPVSGAVHWYCWGVSIICFNFGETKNNPPWALISMLYTPTMYYINVTQPSLLEHYLTSWRRKLS